jgi:transketolase
MPPAVWIKIDLMKAERAESGATNIPALRTKAKNLRRHMLKMIEGQGQGYIGQGLGMADILAGLYFHEMRYDPSNPLWEDRDRFVLSTGHYSIALWAALAEAGIIPLAELSTYGADGSRLEMSTLDSTPGVEIIGGSLGQGLGQGVGMALGLRMDSKKSRVFVELSDGELQEGATWEAAMSASFFKLDSVVAIIDCNNIQADGPLVMGVEPVAEKWKAFGWETEEINGNDMEQILQAFSRARQRNHRPHAIVARTLPGKGIPLIERKEKAHFVRLELNEWEKAMAELEAQP